MREQCTKQFWDENKIGYPMSDTHKKPGARIGVQVCAMACTVVPLPTALVFPTGAYHRPKYNLERVRWSSRATIPLSRPTTSSVPSWERNECDIRSAAPPRGRCTAFTTLCAGPRTFRKLLLA